MSTDREAAIRERYGTLRESEIELLAELAAARKQGAEWKEKVRIERERADAIAENLAAAREQIRVREESQIPVIPRGAQKKMERLEAELAADHRLYIEVREKYYAAREREAKLREALRLLDEPFSWLAEHYQKAMEEMPAHLYRRFGTARALADGEGET